MYNIVREDRKSLIGPIIPENSQEIALAFAFSKNIYTYATGRP